MSETDVFLSHDWGVDEDNRNNHDRVAIVNKALQDKGYVTWFDNDRMQGDIPSQMADGIDNTKVVIVFVTSRYRDKVNGKNASDNCKLEFQFSLHTKANDGVVCVVMENGMKDTTKWRGILGMYCGSRIYIDMSGNLEDSGYLNKQINMLCGELKNLGVVPGEPSREETTATTTTSTTKTKAPEKKGKEKKLQSTTGESNTPDQFIGEYECHIYDGGANKNDWHYVTITYNPDKNDYVWKNRAGVKWTLSPRNEANMLGVGKGCPYFKDGYTRARFTESGVYGPWGEFYKREQEGVMAMAAAKSTTPDQVTGEYECHIYDGGPNKNNWHYVTITYNQEQNAFVWKNRAGRKWTLHPKNGNTLTVGNDCPYYNDGYDEAEFTEDGIYGPGREFYKKTPK